MFLSTQRTMVLGFTQDVPYLLPLNYGFLPGTTGVFYFHGALSGKKIELMGKGVQASFVVYQEGLVITGPSACDWGMNYSSVMGEGYLEIVSDPEEKKKGLDCLMAQFQAPIPYGYDEKVFLRTQVFKLTINNLTAKDKH